MGGSISDKDLVYLGAGLLAAWYIAGKMQFDLFPINLGTTGASNTTGTNPTTNTKVNSRSNPYNMVEAGSSDANAGNQLSWFSGPKIYGASMSPGSSVNIPAATEFYKTASTWLGSQILNSPILTGITGLTGLMGFTGNTRTSSGGGYR